MRKILLLVGFIVFTLNYSQVTSQIDTSTFPDLPVSTQVDGLNQWNVPDTPIPEYHSKIPEVKQYPPAAKFDVNSRLNSLRGNDNSADNIAASMSPNKDKIDLTTTVDIRDTHEVSANGTTWVPKKSIKNTDETPISQQNPETGSSSNGDSSTSSSGILFLLIIVIGVLIFVFSKKKNDNTRKIIVSNGGEPEMREFIKSMFKKLENEVRNNESHLSTTQMSERIIEVIYNTSHDLLYPQISKLQIKYNISASECKQVIDEEIARSIVMLN